MNPEDVLQRYAGQDVPPPRLHADEVLVSARASVRRSRRAALAVAAAGVVTVLVAAGVAVALPDRRPDSGPPAVPPSSPVPSRSVAPLQCTAAALPEFAGVPAAQRAVRAMDPTGRYIVGTSKQGMLIWKDRKVSNPAAARHFVPWDVNATGTVAGHIVEAEKVRRAALYRDGKIVPLPQPAGATSTTAQQLDAAGNAIGFAEFGEDGGGRPLLWPAGGGMIELTPAGAVGAQVADISAAGVIIGFAEIGTLNGPYRWTVDGTGAPLPLQPPGGPHRIAGDWVAGSGSVGPEESTGPSDVRSTLSHAMWNLRTGTAENMGEFQTLALSETGVAFGVVDSDNFRPAVWHDGRVTMLPLLDPAHDHTYVYAGITADGRTIVAGTSTGERGEQDIVVWSC